MDEHALPSPTISDSILKDIERKIGVLAKHDCRLCGIKNWEVHPIMIWVGNTEAVVRVCNACGYMQTFSLRVLGFKFYKGIVKSMEPLGEIFESQTS